MLLGRRVADTGEEDDKMGGDDGIRRIHGRVYLRLDRLLDSFSYLPTVTPDVMTRVLGVDPLPSAHGYAPPSGLHVRLAQAGFLMDVLGGLPRLASLVKRLPPEPPSVFEKLEEILIWVRRCFRLHVKCTAFAIGSFGLLALILKRWLAADAERLLPELLIGKEDLQTAAQGMELWCLAKRVHKNGAVEKILHAGEPWSVRVEELKQVKEGQELLADLSGFLRANGARSAGEFELAIPRWREDPSFLVKILQKYVSCVEKGAYHDVYERRRRQQRAVDEIKALLSPFKRSVFMRLLSSYSTYSTLRENMKYRLMEGYAQLRQVFMEISRVLIDRKVLNKKEDIFFLTMPEILALVKNPDRVEDKQALIRRRREQHNFWESQKKRDVVIGSWVEDASGTAAELTGIGCSPGLAEGFARVLFDPSEAGCLEPGEILVAPHTDPGWTPLFLACKAIITEIGGFLSHGATVAREYGIPAVLNVKEATLRIRTGDFLRVDGTNGLVTICKSHTAHGS